MRDPHVVTLRYKVETLPTVSFIEPPAVEDETNAFRLKLESGKVTCQLKDHFATVIEARNAIDGFFRAWELDIVLRVGQPEIRFVFEDAEVIDRNPPPPGSPRVIGAVGAAYGLAGVTATMSIVRRQYPTPPKHLTINPDVDTLWRRFEGYTNGREPLLSMAYFCLTVIEAGAGGRTNAEKIYLIHRKVLDRLGDLTANRGDVKTARKVRKTSAMIPLNPIETSWIEATVKAIVRRVGEINSDSSLGTITMGDLPAL